MGADGAIGITKTGLPQHRQVKQTFDQDHGGAVVECLPSKPAAFGAGQELVRESAADTAAIQVDDVPCSRQGNRMRRQKRSRPCRLISPDRHSDWKE